MKKNGLLLLGLIIITLLVFLSCERSDMPLSDNTQTQIDDIDDGLVDGMPIEGSYIVVMETEISNFQKSTSLQKTAAMVERTSLNILDEANINKKALNRVYATAIQGFHAIISAGEAELLINDKRVKFIEQDFVIKKKPSPDPVDPPAGQTVPWGITRVGGGATYTGSHVAWIIDSGVDLDHPDLNVDVARSAYFVSRVSSADDDNGHGTHVAGTIAAIDNDIQVVGVAAGATVVPVKVLDRRGSGSLSGVIAGIDYVAANAASGDVANMSLGGGVSTALDDAVYNASQEGIYFALAAGNESDDADNHSPARVNGPNIFTVSALGSNDLWALFSNYGNPPVDYAAPGVSIFSLYKKGGTATMSSTSMAAPHMAGVLLLTNGHPNTDGYVLNDPDGDPDPIAHE